MTLYTRHKSRVCSIISRDVRAKLSKKILNRLDTNVTRIMRTTWVQCTGCLSHTYRVSWQAAALSRNTESALSLVNVSIRAVKNHI